jgi:FkbM family methyltransferase
LRAREILELKRNPSKGEALSQLIKNQLSVDVVVDIGVQHGTPELTTCFPDKPHILFEPISEYYESIKKNYEFLSYELISKAASNTTAIKNMQIQSLYGRHPTHARITQSANPTQENRQIECVTLDSELSGRLAGQSVLLKIDVDGHDVAVLRGAEVLMRSVSCLIVEATIPRFAETLAVAESMGMKLWEICELCYYRGAMSQVDLIFLSAEEFDKHQALKTAGKWDQRAWFKLA